MKWFKHETKRKASLKRLIMEFGIEGYGLYWLCLELISGDMAIDNLTFELEEDAELIAHEFKMDTIRVEKIMHRCIELGLFDLSDNGRLRCLGLAVMLDESISRNENVKQMKKKVKEKLDIKQNSGNIPVTINTPSSQIRREENRIDKSIIENKKFKKPTEEEISIYLKEKGIILDITGFIHYYNSKGWRVGNSPMVCWKSAIQTWKRNEKKYGTSREQEKSDYQKEKEVALLKTEQRRKDIKLFEGK